MGAVWLVALAEWRRRWRSLAVLVVLTGLAGGVTLAAFTGSRRAETSFDRLLKSEKASNLIVETEEAPDAELVRDAAKLPGVKVASHLALLMVAPAGSGLLAGQDSIAVAIPVVVGADPADLFHIVEGRRYDEQRADELLVNEAMRDRLDAEVGDRLALVSLTPEQWAAVDAGGEFPVPAGPSQDVTLVGVTRSAEDVSDAPDPLLIVTPAFYARHAADISRAEMVGLRANEDDLPGIENGIRSLFGGDATVRPADDLAARIDDGIAVEVDGLRVFALAAGIAGLVALGLALVRQAETVSIRHPVYRALGMTSRQLAVSSVASGLPVAVGGALFAAVGAFAGGPLAVTGLARQAEPDPGVWFDPLLLPGAVLVGLIVLALTAGTSALVVARGSATGRTSSGRVSRTAGVLAGLPPPVGIGVRMALDRRRGPGALPTRPALVGAAVGVAGLVAALGIGARVDHLLATPRLWGADYDAVVVAGTDMSSHNRSAEQLARDADVEAVAVFDSLSVAVYAGERTDRVGATMVRSRGGTVSPVIPDGHAPATPDEVALGDDALNRLDIDVGDTVAVDRDGKRVTLRVVGTYLHPGDDDANSGMFVTPRGFEGLEGEDDDSGVLVRFAPGVDTPVAVARLRDLGERVDVTAATQQVPSNIDNLDELGALPTGLAGLVTLLAATATAHTLSSATRRRQHDLAVLRALGFVGRQLRSTLRWQALTVATIGLAIGIPAGLIAERRIWSALAEAIGVTDDWTPPWLIVVVAVPATLAVAVVLAILPGQAAVRASPSRILRAD